MACFFKSNSPCLFEEGVSRWHLKYNSDVFLKKVIIFFKNKYSNHSGDIYAIKVNSYPEKEENQKPE